MLMHSGSGIYIAAFVFLALNLFFFTYPLSWTSIGVGRRILESLLDYFFTSGCWFFLYAARENRNVSQTDFDRC